jgi:hypothetical protein
LIDGFDRFNPSGNAHHIARDRMWWGTLDLLADEHIDQREVLATVVAFDGDLGGLIDDGTNAEEASNNCRTLPRNCWAVATPLRSVLSLGIG